MKERGFTIAELLVAATISILIVALLGVMFGSILKTTSRTSASIDAFRDARAALATMKRDLSAVVAAKPGAYFALDVDGAGNVGAVNFAALRQIAALISLKNQQGDLCAVRYYCGWDGKAYSLKRFFRDSTSTAQVFRTLYNSNGYADLGQLYCSNIANCATAATADEVLASYAWSLRATVYDTSGNIINSFVDPGGYATTNLPYVCDPSPTPTPSPTPSPTPTPAALEVSFKAMSPTAARTLLTVAPNQSVWMAGDNKMATSPDLQLYKRLIEPNTYVFRTRINLR